MNLEDKLLRIQRKAEMRNFVPRYHTRGRMREREISTEDICAAIASGQIIEDYPNSDACLVSGYTQAGRPLHIVCSTTGTLYLITVYEPEPPYWITPMKRGE